MDASIAVARNNFHKRLFESNTLTITAEGVASNVDGSNNSSKQISQRIVEILVEKSKLNVHVRPKISGQTLGNQCEEITMQFIKETFPQLQNIRPGNWSVLQLGNNNHIKTSDFA